VLPVRFKCRIGRHQYVTRVEGGEEYTVCAVCGKERDDGEIGRPGFDNKRGLAKGVGPHGE